MNPTTLFVGRPSMIQAKPRSDGVATRQRLLLVATRLFARHGYSAISTRAIVQEAATNVAAIRYYFGGKEGLYRAALARITATASNCEALVDSDTLSRRQALRNFYLDQVRPAHQALSAGAHRQDGADMAFRARHLALVKVLCSVFAVSTADEELHRLAITMAGLASPLLTLPQAIADIEPALIDSAHALERWAEHLAGNAELMLSAEAARRQSLAKQTDDG